MKCTCGRDDAPDYLELWWNRDEALEFTLFAVMGCGQRSVVGAEVFGPFDGPQDAAQWLTRQLRACTGLWPVVRR